MKIRKIRKRGKRPPVEKNVHQVPLLNAPICFGKMFFNTDRTQCEYNECILRALCKQEASINYRVNKSIGELVSVKISLGERFLATLTKELDQHFWIKRRQKFYNVVVNGYEDKWRYRYLRIWVSSKGLRVDVSPTLAVRLEELNWRVKLFKQYRKASFRPHIGGIRIRDKFILERFLRIFLDWAKCREFKEITEVLDVDEEDACTIS